MKKRDYYILAILVILVVSSAFYRTQQQSDIEAKKENEELHPTQKTEILPIEDIPAVNDSISNTQV